MVSRGSVKHAAEFHFSDSFKLFEVVEMRGPTGLELTVFTCRKVSSLDGFTPKGLVPESNQHE